MEICLGHSLVSLVFFLFSILFILFCVPLTASLSAAGSWLASVLMSSCPYGIINFCDLNMAVQKDKTARLEVTQRQYSFYTYSPERNLLPFA